MPKYTLYQLVGDANDPDGRVISPHVWKTKLDLAFFGLEVTNSGKTFPQIRGELSEVTKNPSVTVPTLEIDQGEYMTDSWKIAEYLEAEHGTPEKSLFGGSKEGKEFAKFIEIWSNTTLANELRPLVGVSITSRFDSPSKQYFIKSKFNGDIKKHSQLVDKFQPPSGSDNNEELEKQLLAARKQLSTINELLKHKKQQAAGDGDESLWLLGGKEPSHADFCLFGWYTSSILHPGVEKGVWRHKDNEFVEEWLDRLLDSGLVNKSQLD